jgi:hypothetical protein
VDPISREIAIEIVVLILVLDTLFFGVTIGSVLRWVDGATWYRAPGADEAVLYRHRGGGRYRGWLLSGLINAMVTNRRFIVRILWSRIALIDVPISALRYIRAAKWWWLDTVEVAWGTTPRIRAIQLIATRRGQAELLAAFQAVGARVEA